MSDDIEWRTTHGDRVEVYASETIDVRGAHLTAHGAPPEWRWRVVARNGRVIEHGESHTRRRDAVRAALRHHPVVEVAS